MKFEIRNATDQDLEKYTDLMQQTFQVTYVNKEIGLTADCFSKTVFSTTDTQQYLSSLLQDTNEHKTWLAFKGGELVGSITCIIKNDHEAELTGFYVRPDKQGLGIGKRLYDLVLDFSDTRDLLLDIYAHNTKTIELYKRWGWKLDTTRGEGGYFTRHWPEWPEEVKAQCIYMRLKK